MQSTMTLKRHAELVDRMASSLGLDLEQAMMEARLTVDALGDMVLACTGCPRPETCEHWLAQHRNAITETTPAYCRNSETLALLKDGKQA